MNEEHGIRRRAAVRDALATRTRALTAGVLTVSAALSGLFAGIAAASAPGHKPHSGTSAQAANVRQTAAHSSSAIPPLPAAPGPGSLGSASPAPAPAPSPTQSPPAVVSGGS